MIFFMQKKNIFCTTLGSFLVAAFVSCVPVASQKLESVSQTHVIEKNDESPSVNFSRAAYSALGGASIIALMLLLAVLIRDLQLLLMSILVLFLAPLQ